MLIAVLGPIPGRVWRILRLAVLIISRILALCFSWLCTLQVSFSSRACVRGGEGRVDSLDKSKGKYK